MAFENNELACNREENWSTDYRHMMVQPRNRDPAEAATEFGRDVARRRTIVMDFDHSLAAALYKRTQSEFEAYRQRHAGGLCCAGCLPLGKGGRGPFRHQSG
jgi:hypothetical protein